MAKLRAYKIKNKNGYRNTGERLLKIYLFFIIHFCTLL